MDDNDLTLLRRQHIGFVFQFYNLLPMLNAEENVKLPLSVAGENADECWFKELVTKVGIAERLKHRPSEMSGGQQQRVAVARSLVSRPTVVFADEPTGNLDSKSGGEILQLLRDSVRLVRPDDRDGHARSARGLVRRPDPVPRGRADRARPDGRERDRGARHDEQAGHARPADVIKISLKDLFGRKLRLILTSLAIVMGVAMVSGTFVLTDTINAGFTSIFSTAYSSSDAVVTGKQAFGNSQNAPSFPESTLARVQGAARRRRRRRRDRRPGAVRGRRTARSSGTAARPASRSARTGRRSSTRSSSSTAAGRTGRTRLGSTSTRRTASTTRSASS